MLSPDELLTSHEILRPPAGCQLDAAVATTYTLDLLTLLGAPVAFAMFDLRQADDPVELSGLWVLESVRRHADAITVFCQAGQIAVPAAYRDALAWTEGSVVQVARPAPGRLFHPKSWTLRFVDDAGRCRHRIIVLSRNLTMGRAWDVVVTLDEEPDADAETGDESGAGVRADAGRMSDFLRQLPDLAAAPMPADRRAVVLDVAASVAKAQFAVPSPFDSAEVWPLGGVANAGWPYPRQADRRLIISPFLNSSTVRRVADHTPTTLVSRSDAIDDIGPLADDLTCYTLVGLEEAPIPADAESGAPDDDSAISPPDSVDITDDADSEPAAASEQPARSNSGLHAKAVISDLPGGESTQWMVGSANATHNAHAGNIELGVRLAGPSALCGVSTLLEGRAGTRDKPTFADLLEPYRPIARDPDAEAQKDAEQRLDDALTDAATAGCTTAATPREDGDYRISIAFHQLPESADITYSCRPLSLNGHLSRSVASGQPPAAWDRVSLRSLTPYVVLSAHLSEPVALTRSAVLVGHLYGAPENRREHVLADLLNSADKFLHYLMLLLATGAGDDEAWAAAADVFNADPHAQSQQGHGSGGADLPILETLLRASALNPGVLDDIERLVSDLRKAGVGEEIIPPDFDRLWRTLREAVAHS